MKTQYLPLQQRCSLSFMLESAFYSDVDFHDRIILQLCGFKSSLTPPRFLKCLYQVGRERSCLYVLGVSIFLLFLRLHIHFRTSMLHVYIYYMCGRLFLDFVISFSSCQIYIAVNNH